MKKQKMFRGSGRFELKKRIYTAALISVLALIFLTVLFMNMLDQQRSLLNEIEKRHFNSITTLSTQFSKLSNDHIKVVDLLTSSTKNLNVKTVRRVSARFIRDIGRLSRDLRDVRDEFSSTKEGAELHRRLVRNVSKYRKSVVAAVSIGSLNIRSAVGQLRQANRDYRQVNGDFEALIQQSRKRAHLSIVAALQSFDTHTYEFGSAVVLIIILLAAVVFIILHAVSHDLAGITRAMSELASGRRDAQIPGLERRDEIGEMARATAIFKSNFDQLDDLAVLEEKSQALEEKVQTLQDAKQTFETKVNTLNSSAQSLAEARDAAKAADKAKSELLAAISYEIRTPMNGLMGMAGLILDDDLSNEQREYVAGMRDSGATLLEVVNNLLDYANLEAGQLRLEITEFDLAKLIETVPDLIAGDRADLAPRLHFNLSPDVPRRLVGDPERYSQTLVNLLTAAIRSSEHGEIEIDISSAEKRSKDALVRLQIVDHQSPVTPNNVQSRVNRAWQSHDPEAADAATKGLAMAISKQFATLMDGEIGHERTEDGNDRFWFTAHLGIAANASQGWKEDTKRLTELRVLIVDASNASCDVLCRQLEGWGMVVDRANDGRTALARMARAQSQKQQFDIAIVADLLPDMHGIAFIRAMRSSDGTGDVKVMMTYGSDGPPPEDQMDQLKIAQVMEQPATPLRLLDGLNAVIDGQARTQSGDRETMPKAASERKLRILLVDDNQVNRRVVTVLLKPAGHIVDVVVNGAEAVKAVQSAPYDIVLMDIQMPEMDGVTATQEIRCLAGDIANVPIVALTANAMGGDREKYLDAGMDDYIAKPIDKVQLLDVINRLGNNDIDGMGESARPTAAKDGDAEPDEKTRSSETRTGS